jgi:hypothetical protein
MLRHLPVEGKVGHFSRTAMTTLLSIENLQLLRLQDFRLFRLVTAMDFEPLFHDPTTLKAVRASHLAAVSCSKPAAIAHRTGPPH